LQVRRPWIDSPEQWHPLNNRSRSRSRSSSSDTRKHGRQGADSSSSSYRGEEVSRFVSSQLRLGAALALDRNYTAIRALEQVSLALSLSLSLCFVLFLVVLKCRLY